MVGIKIKRGQCLRLETPGGGGYGAATERALDLVEKDVRLGYVTLMSAREDYKVVIDEFGKLDEGATKSLRFGAGT